MSRRMSVMTMICALTKHGISSSDGREVEFDLLAGSLKLLAEGAILRHHVSTDKAEIARSQSILYASLMILQSVAVEGGGVRPPLASGQTAQRTYSKVSMTGKPEEGAAHVSTDS